MTSDELQELQGMQLRVGEILSLVRSYQRAEAVDLLIGFQHILNEFIVRGRRQVYSEGLALREQARVQIGFEFQRTRDLVERLQTGIAERDRRDAESRQVYQRTQVELREAESRYTDLLARNHRESMAARLQDNARPAIFTSQPSRRIRRLSDGGT